MVWLLDHLHFETMSNNKRHTETRGVLTPKADKGWSPVVPDENSMLMKDPIGMRAA